MNKKVFKTVQMAMFAAVSVVLVYFVRFPLFPSAPFLKYDMADVPVLLCGLLLGPVEGIITLLVTCLIQAFFIDADSGVIGFLMHFIASSALVLFASLIYRKKKNQPHLIAGLISGALAMTVLMIPLNLIFTGIFMGAGVDTVKAMLIPAIIPFNLLKAGINAAVTFVVFYPIKKGFEAIQKQRKSF